VGYQGYGESQVAAGNETLSEGGWGVEHRSQPSEACKPAFRRCD